MTLSVFKVTGNTISLLDYEYLHYDKLIFRE